MAETIVDAAVSDGVGSAIFFLTDQYVVYDYATDRVRDGVHALSTFPVGKPTGFPESFAPAGPATSIDAALRGKGPYDGAAYFFRGPSYMRQVAAPTPEFQPREARQLSLWNFPVSARFPERSFPDVQAAFNGALNRDAYCYFFRGIWYIRYIWASSRVDANYPKKIGTLDGMPTFFAAGIDGAVDGAGRFADASYLFKDDRYVRFQWVDSGRPHGVGGIKPIQPNWPGLQELLLAGKAKSHALEWLRVAQARLAGLAAGTLNPAELAVLTAALLTHFHTVPTDTVSITHITNMLAAVETTLRNSGRNFRFRTDSEAVAEGVPNIDAAYTHPWPPTAATGISFTRNFPTRPERNRVSSVIHEAVHVNDPASATPQTHISEWYVSPTLAPILGLTPIWDDVPAFAGRYDLQSLADALHNPSSYATFARHLFFGVDNRENL